MVYLDERGQVLTEHELLTEYNNLVKNGETDAPTFSAYVANCCGKNGTLTRIERG